MLEIDISIGLITILFFGSLMVSLFLGVPLAFALGGVAVLFTILFWGPASLHMVASKFWGSMRSVILVALPMFILMGATLARSGIAEDLYQMAYLWIGRIAGGLAMGTVGICTLFAAMTGSSAPATVTMGLITLPSMLKRKYSPTIAIGSIAAGGALGILIPPSISMIVFSAFTGVSVGQMFIGGIFPGLLLSTLFIIYIAITCRVRPRLGPPIPLEEKTSLRQKLISLRAVILPIILIISVLGSIYTGIATPTEASSVGAAGALIIAAIYRKLNRVVVWDIVKEAARLTTLAMWIIAAGLVFAATYQAIGAGHLIMEMLEGLPLGRWGILIIMQLTFFVLGMLMDPIAIIFITMPVYFPIILHLGFDPLWFGVVFIVNMEMAFLTPPFGFNLFFLRAVTPKEISMGQIYRACLPFIAVQALGLVLVILFPQIILWLPSTMI